jgi:hypothetical protein
MSTTDFVLLEKLWESADFILFCGQSADGSDSCGWRLSLVKTSKDKL